MSEAIGDLSWLSELPDYVARLADLSRLREAGVHFLARDDAEARTNALREHYAGSFHLGTLWLESVWAECRERVARCLVLARGPARTDALQVEREALLILREDQPDELWLAWSSDVPASLWIPCGRTPEAILAALAELAPPTRPTRTELDCRTRLGMGYRGEVAVPNPYSGEFVAADPHDFARHFTFSPVVDPHHWGSCCVDDPWPDPAGERLSQIQQIVIQREVTRQAPGGICSFTRRTKFSGSYLGIELHLGHIYVWNVLHRRSLHSPVIEQFNARHGTRFPTTLPFDVVAAMMGFAHLDIATLQADLEHAEQQGDEGLLPQLLELLAALQCTDMPAIGRLLRRHLEHPALEVRGTVAQLAARYGWVFLLEELLLTEPDPSLRAWITSVLPLGVEEEFDEHGEPIPWGDDDEGDDYEEDEP